MCAAYLLTFVASESTLRYVKYPSLKDRKGLTSQATYNCSNLLLVHKLIL